MFKLPILSVSSLPNLQRSLLPLLLASLFLPAHAEPVAGETKADAKAQAAKWDVKHPPGPVQTVKLDVRSGTLMSVDVSPDGSQLIFDLLGDLYLLPIAGGKAKPLTQGMAWDMQARFSPDGKQITYVSDAGGGDNVWVMQVDGSNPRPVSQEKYRLLNNPVWHPQGEYIAARKHFSGTRSIGSGEIWLFHKNGGAGVQMTEKPNWQKDLGEPAFSPGGRYLYYSHDATPGTSFEYNKNSNDEIYQIFRRDLERGKTIAFVRGAGGAVRPTPSPDGRYLAFVRRIRNQSTLFLKDLQSGEETPVWAELERDMQEAWAIHGVYPVFAWMPGSRELVIWAKGKLWRVNPFVQGKPGRAAAREIPFHVQDSREIRPALRFAQEVAPDQFPVRQLRWVQVAPQGDKLIYSALGHLYLRALPDGKPQRLTKQNDHFEYFPRFSRDGKFVAYTTWDDEKLGSVRVLDLASGKEKVISRSPGKYLTPEFAPDGRQVAFVKAAGGYLTTPWHGLNTGVYMAAADGSSAPRLITENGSQPQFAAANDHLFVNRHQQSSEVDESFSLWRINLAKYEEQEIVKSETASEFVVAPNGKYLAFIDHFHAYLLPMPAVGKVFVTGKGNEALPLKQLDVNAGQYLHWSGDARQLYFALGDELFSRDVAQTLAPTDKDASPPKPEPGRKIGFTAQADKPRATLVLDGAKIISMKGDEVIENGRIVVKDNRIAAIGPQAEVALPTGAQVIDVRGKSIIPGLVDVHWHGGMGEEGIIPQQSWIDQASLAFGITTLHDPSNDSAQIFTHSEMQRAGLLQAPRIFSTGTVLYGAKASISAPVDNLDDALTHLRRLQAMGAISVKSYNQPRREQRQQVLEAARQTGMMVVPEGGSLFQHNMSMVIDGHTGIEHALPVANVYEDVLQLWSQTKVGYTPTLGVGYGGLDGEHYWYAYSEVWKHPLLSKHVPASLLRARAVRRPIAPEEDYNVFNIARHANLMGQHGIKVNLGAHGQREGLAAHWEMWTMAKGGATPLQAIRFATLNGAQYLGMEKDIGSLEVGKLADLVVVDADLSQNIYHSDRVRYVMQNGRLYDAAGMDQIAPVKKARRPYFFAGQQADVPVGLEQGLGHGGHGH